MTTYHLDNTFASLPKLLPGDIVALARGSVFHETLVLRSSGRPDAPITITAYGEGEPPIFAGPMGIHGSKASHIIIQDLAFVGTDGGAIYAGSAKGWVIDNVLVKDTGSVSGVGGINFKTSSDITIKNSTFDGVKNDGIFIDGVTNVNITNNTMTNLTGKTADGIQVNNGKNVFISDNEIDQRGTTSLKGGIITQYSEHVVVSGNTILGGSFGLGINGHHVLIDGNTVSGQTSSGWSAGILISGEENVGDYTVTNNTVTNANYGVAVTGLKAWKFERADIDITSNLFVDIVEASLKIDKPATGSFSDNVTVDSATSLIKGEGLKSPFGVTGTASLSSTQFEAVKTAVGRMAQSPSLRSAILRGNPNGNR